MRRQVATLSSGERLLRNIARPVAPLLSATSDRWLRARYGGAAPAQPVVFLVGAPRTGSTLLFQLITHYLAVGYTDNFAAIFHRNWLSALWLGNLLARDRPHGVFRSRHGGSEGWHAPSEAGEFWYRWVPRDRHFLEAPEIPAATRRMLRAELVAATGIVGRPLVFKNLPMGQRMRLVADVLPEARFVHCRRDPCETVLSILAARRRLGIAPVDWWSVMPRNVDALRGLDEVDRVVEQVLCIEAQIAEDSRLFPETRLIEIDYGDTCSAPELVLARIAAFAGAGWRSGVSLPVSAVQQDRGEIDVEVQRLVAQRIDQARARHASVA